MCRESKCDYVHTPAVHSMHPRQNQTPGTKGQEVVTHLVCCRSGSSSPHLSRPRSLACHHRGTPREMHSSPSRQGTEDRVQRTGVAGVGEEGLGLLLSSRPQDLEPAVCQQLSPSGVSSGDRLHALPKN